MNVEVSVLHRLLDLQTEDTAIQRLNERKASLPEAQRLTEVEEQLAELSSDHEIATKQSTEVAREQDRIEGEISIVDAKIAKEEQRMYSGGVSNPKELSALQAEVESLKKKRSATEDQLLEVMVTREDATATLDRLTQERNELTAVAEQLRLQVGELTSEIDAELATHTSTREEMAAEIPAELLSLYDKLREQKAGVGAAALEGGMCMGCHTKLPAKEIEHIRNEGGLQRCDNCRRILVIV